MDNLAYSREFICYPLYGLRGLWEALGDEGVITDEFRNLDDN